MTAPLVESVPAVLRVGLPGDVAPAPARRRVPVDRPSRFLTDAEVAQMTPADRARLVEQAETLAALADALRSL